MERALWVTAETPDHHLGGGNARQAHLIEALARRAETHLFVDGALRDERVRACVASVTEVGSRLARRPATTTGRRVRDLRLALVERRPAEVVEFRPVRIAMRHALLAAPPVDVACVQHATMAPLLHAAPADRWVLDLPNVNSERLRQTIAVTSGRRQRWLLGRDLIKAERFERWLLASFDLVLAPSDDDMATLPGTSVRVVPNGVDTARFVPEPVPSAPGLVFTGTLFYGPNVDGVRWFCAEVLPRVQEQVPDATLDVVGREPTADVRALETRRGVNVHADVPDIGPFLARARVALVPLRIGTGTRLKALDAMAAGRPVVGTTIGLAGLELERGRHALIEDEPGPMAAAIVDLLTDDELARRLAAEGRHLVERRYSWQRIAERFVELILK